jgi:hypothetical protein
MADTARAAGIGPEIQYQGHVYRFKPVTPEMIGRYETWLERRAFEAVKRQERWMPPADYAAQLAGVRQDCAADVYAFGGEAFGKSSVSVPGLKYAAYLSLRAGQDATPDPDGPPPVTERLASELFDAERDQVLAHLFTIRWLVKTPEADGGPPQ